jgi:hypothetical protein
MTTKVPALIDWLVNAFTIAPTLGAAVPPVTIYDGPPTTGLDASLKLFVGLTDPDNPAAEEAATWVQSRGDLGLLTRDEISSIHCCAEAWSGPDTLQPMRLAVTAIVAAVEVIIRSDATQFGGNAALAAPGVDTSSLVQNNTQTGAVARIPFDITFKSFT